MVQTYFGVRMRIDVCILVVADVKCFVDYGLGQFVFLFVLGTRVDVFFFFCYRYSFLGQVCSRYSSSSRRQFWCGSFRSSFLVSIFRFRIGGFFFGKLKIVSQLDVRGGRFLKFVLFFLGSYFFQFIQVVFRLFCLGLVLV